MKISFYSKALISFGALMITINLACNAQKTRISEDIAYKKTVKKISRNFSEATLYNELMARQPVEKSLAGDTVKTIIQRNTKLAEYSSAVIHDALLTLYGEDLRYNIYDQEISPKLRSEAKNVACLISRDQLKQNQDGSFELQPTGKYGSSPNLCSFEKFLSEPVVAFGTGFAVGEHTFLTAGHCINASNIANVLIIYGYLVDGEGANLKIQSTDIYEPVQIIAAETGVNDYAVIKTKQSFSKEKIFKIRDSGKINDNESVYVIGYPRGLPVKISINASVFKNNLTNTFQINSSTCAGNSGSPVINANTHLVEGIFVGGDQDFQFIAIDDCYGSVKCPKNIGSCTGEIVTRTTQFLKFVNQ